MTDLKIRSLSPDFAEKVMPHLPQPENHVKIDRAMLNAQMKRMNEEKEHCLKTYWAHLLDDVAVSQLTINARDGYALNLRVYQPNKTTGKLPVVYAIHGGAFITGSIDSEDLITRQLSHECDVVVFSIEHHLTPEHKVIPTIFTDVEDGLKWVFSNAAKHNGDRSKFFLSGTSIGGTMAAILAFRSDALGVPIKGTIMRQPAFIYGTYEQFAKKEWLSYLMSRIENADAPLLSGKIVDTVNAMLSITPEEAVDPENFPIFASAEQLEERIPPSYIVGAGCDPMVDEVTLFVKLLEQVGVPVKYHLYEGMPHGFHSHHIVREAKDEMFDTAEGLQWLMRMA